MSELDDLITIKVLVVETDGTATVKRISRRLESWQAEVGGGIEALWLTADVNCYINENGKYEGMMFNPVGDLVVRTLLQEGGRQLIPGDHIVGPVVFCGQPDSAGWDTDVPERLLDWFRNTRNDLIRFTDLEEEP